MLLCSVVVVNAITRGQFYPHGPWTDQRVPRGADASSPEIPLNVPVIFYGQEYDSVFVSTFLSSFHPIALKGVMFFACMYVYFFGMLCSLNSLMNFGLRGVIRFVLVLNMTWIIEFSLTYGTISIMFFRIVLNLLLFKRGKG